MLIGKASPEDTNLHPIQYQWAYDLYQQAVQVVTRDRKASTSYIQRRLQIGYNRAASLIERMEKEGVVSPATHAGKRDILAGPPPVV